MSSVDLKKGHDPVDIIIYNRKKDIVIKEISLIAFDRDSKKVIAVGNDVLPLINDKNSNSIILSPLKYGIIADYGVAQYMFKHMLQKASLFSSMFKPKIAVCVPKDITEVENKAFLDLFYQIGARKVIISEEQAKEINQTLYSEYSAIVEIVQNKKNEQTRKEVWKEECIGQIPQGIYEIISINSNQLEYIIILESSTHRVQMEFNEVTAIRTIQKACIPDEVFLDEKTDDLRRNKFENILYEIEEGELNNFIKENGIGKARYINIKQYIIISKYYIIEILTEKKPDICVLDLNETK